MLTARHRHDRQKRRYLWVQTRRFGEDAFSIFSYDCGLNFTLLSYVNLLGGPIVRMNAGFFVNPFLLCYLMGGVLVGGHSAKAEEAEAEKT